MIVWNAKPEIVTVGPIVLRWYTLMFVFNFLACYLVMRRIYRNENRSIDKVNQLFVYVFFATLIGARLGHCFFYDPAFYWSHPLEILMVGKGGLSSHGAVIGIALTLWFYVKKNPEFSYIWVADRMAIVLAFPGIFVRIGNLFNSEIIGIKTEVPWAFVFTRVDMIPRHPAQIYEALCNAFIFIALLVYYRKNYKKMADGFLLGLYFVLTFTGRFLIEFFKEHHSAFEEGMLLNMGQILSIPVVLAGIILLLRARFNQYSIQSGAGIHSAMS